MTVKDLIENLRLEFNPAPDNEIEATFKEALWIKRLNNTLRRFLHEGLLWDYIHQETLSTGTNFITLPSYYTVFRKFSGEASSYLLVKKVSDDAKVPVNEVEAFDIIQDIPEAKIPNQYVIVGSVVSFNHNTTEDLTVDMQFYRTLTADLVLADDIKSEVPVFDDTFQDYLVEVMMKWIGGMQAVERGELIRAYAGELQYLRENTYRKENSALSDHHGTDSRIRNIDIFSVHRKKLLWEN